MNIVYLFFISPKNGECKVALPLPINSADPAIYTSQTSSGAFLTIFLVNQNPLGGEH